MKAILALVLLAMFRVTPQPEEATRLEPVAEAIATEAWERPLWDGEAGAEATALALVAIGRHESGFQERVRRCETAGDNGRSVGVYQVMRGLAWQGYSRDDICQDDRLQARLALDVLRLHRSRCQRCGAGYLFRAYAAGDGGVNSKAARDMLHAWERLLSAAGLRQRGASVERLSR